MVRLSTRTVRPNSPWILAEHYLAHLPSSNGYRVRTGATEGYTRNFSFSDVILA
jgi:hypothetical protein